MKKIFSVLFIYYLFNTLVLSQIPGGYGLTGTGTVSDPVTGTLYPGDLYITPSMFSTSPVYFANVTLSASANLTIGYGLEVETLEGYSMTMNQYSTLMMTAGSAFTARTFINNGNVILGSSEHEPGSSSIIFLSGYSGTGTVRTQLYLSGGYITSGGSTYHRWHYFTPPVDGISTDIFTANTPDLTQYIESRVSSNNMAGWVAYDGFEYIGGTMTGITFNQLSRGKGYNYYCGSGITYTITGALNYQSSDVSMNLTCGSGYPNIQGFNLLGNPFPSYIDWDLISLSLPSNVNDAIYFTHNDQVASYVGGVSQGGASNYIPPMQGFFVKTTSASTITIPAAARSHDPFHQIRYKGGNSKGSVFVSDTIHMIRLELKSNTDSTDLVVRFTNEATNDFDKKYDAYKYNKTSSILSAWTAMNGIDYAINALPFPETIVNIPVNIYVSEPGHYKISSGGINKLDGYKIVLRDLSTNITVDLSKGEYLEFNIPAGLVENRFILTVTNISTGVSESFIPKRKFSVFQNTGFIYIRMLTDEFNDNSATLSIYDLTGRRVINENGIIWQGNGDIKQISCPSISKGIYIIEIKDGKISYVDKVILN
jgi:hypothetical protein